MHKANFEHELPPIWVANLLRSPHRRQFMKQQLDALGVDYDFVVATDGRSLTEEEKAKYSKKRAVKEKGRELHPNEIGCALTHAKMWQKMVDLGLSEVLILEDDVHITPALVNVLFHRAAFPPDWHIINFMTNATPIPLDDAPLFETYKICKFKGGVNGTPAYLINLEGVRQSLKHLYRSTAKVALVRHSIALA